MDKNLFATIYIVLFGSTMVSSAKSEIYSPLTFAINPDLVGRRCTNAETVFVANTKNIIACALSCKIDFKCKSIFYNKQSEKCFICEQKYNSTSGLVPETGTNYYYIKLKDTLQRDCKKIIEDSPTAQTGVYSILPPGGRESVNVICDMETDGGGWTVFQYRFNGTVNFTLPRWNYIYGFGSPYREYWLGLEPIHRLTKGEHSTLYMQFTDVDDDVAVEVANGFKVDGHPGYEWYIGDGVFWNDSTDGKFLLKRYSGMSFSSIDEDLDIKPDVFCAAAHLCGWWFRGCTFFNPNGEYVVPGTVSENFGGRAGMVHDLWRGRESLKGTKLMFRRLD